MNIYYRTEEMLSPSITYGTHPIYPNEVVAQISFVPTFQGSDPQADPQIVHDEKPIVEDVLDQSKIIYTFIIDRSGSMYGERIEMAKNALILFMRSLPKGCKFCIISFGTHFAKMCIKGEEIIPYNDWTSGEAIRLIERYDNDFGGTNLLEPLLSAQTQTNDRSFITKYGDDHE